MHFPLQINQKPMKKNVLFLSLALIILASCGIMTNNDFASRKYTHFRKGEVAVKTSEKAKQTTSSSKNNDVAIEEKTNITEQTGSTTETKENQQVATKSSSKVFNYKSETKNSEVNQNTTSFKVSKPSIKSVLKKLDSKKQTTGDDGTMTIILIILALFIPPLAVLIAVGLKTPFWLNLLLCILAGGFGFGLGMPYLWLVAVIHAIIVVLGRN